MTESTTDLLQKLLRGLEVLERRVGSFDAEAEEEREVVETALQQIRTMRRELYEAQAQLEDSGA